MANNQESFKPKHQFIRGLPFPDVPWFKQKNIEDAMDYEPKDGDTIIASYPKTGTTWMQYILLQIVSKSALFPSFDDVNNTVVPYMEMTGVAALEALVKPRIYKHHLPYNMVQKNSKSKTLYIYRHPEDTVVSFYHFFKSIFKGIPLDFAEFVDSFVMGNTTSGSYFKHVLSFYEHREDSNMLMISYETLHANRRAEVLQIAKFLDESHYEYLLEHEDILDKILEHTSFDHMKNNLYLSNPESKEKIDFFRKGIIGDGKNSLTLEQQSRIKAAAEAVLKGTSIFEQWYPNAK